MYQAWKSNHESTSIDIISIQNGLFIDVIVTSHVAAEKEL